VGPRRGGPNLSDNDMDHSISSSTLLNVCTVAHIYYVLLSVESPLRGKATMGLAFLMRTA
jgi:hypothetical protein